MGLIVTCAAAVAGIGLADVRPVEPMPLLWAATAAAIALVWVRQSAARALALIALASALGAARVALVPPAPTLPLQDAFVSLRAKASAAIQANLPEPQASLASGVLLGGSGRLDSGFREDLQRSGLSHVLAIDGFKQVVLAGSIGWLTSRLFGVRPRLLLMVLCVVSYTLLTGAHPSAVRAGLMLSLSSLAALRGRLPDPLSSVLVAAVIMAGLDPRVLLDVGMQLSLSATLGLILLWPVLRRRGAVRRLPCWLGEPVGLSAAVTLACLPVTLATFEQVSLVSPLAHVLAVPLLPAVLLGSGLLSVTAPLPPPLPLVAAWIAWAPTSMLTIVIRLSGELPGAAITTGRLPLGGSVGLAATLLAVGLWHQPELAKLRDALEAWLARQRLPLAATATCGLFAAALQVVRPDGRTHIDPLTVGSGQAVFIRGPTGRTTLVVQGNADARALASETAAHLSVWEHGLDTVVVRDQPAARAVALTLRRYPANQVVAPTSGPTTSAARPGSGD